jgi:DNA excision repair protein ERCC-5
MGVKDLWQLLSPVGRRVSIETLENKTIAVDARFLFYFD